LTDIAGSAGGTRVAVKHLWNVRLSSPLDHLEAPNERFNLLAVVEASFGRLGRPCRSAHHHAKAFVVK